MIAFAFGYVRRMCSEQGRKDIAILLRAKRFAAIMDHELQGRPHGSTIERINYRIVVTKPSEFTAGKFGLQVQTPDDTRIIGVIMRYRPADLYHDNPTHRLAWA